MEYVKLGNTGLDISRLCLGCMGFGDANKWLHQWVLNEEDSRLVIKKALDLGINFLIQQMYTHWVQVRNILDELLRIMLIVMKLS